VNLATETEAAVFLVMLRTSSYPLCLKNGLGLRILKDIVLLKPLQFRAMEKAGFVL